MRYLVFKCADDLQIPSENPPNYNKNDKSDCESVELFWHFGNFYYFVNRYGETVTQKRA